MPDSILELRRRGQAARLQLSDQSHGIFSLAICDRFLRSPLFIRNKHIACYLPTGQEVDTTAVIERAWRMEKRVFVPVIQNAHDMRFVQITRNTRMERNQFGIWEPTTGRAISAKKLDVVVTPLTVFDDQRNRIGMGGGYYDRQFAFLRHRHRWLHPKLVGFAFACQKVEKIWPNPWDIRLYRVFTESR
jgi:5-formyltetrahydrofolate cyclo-ligase